MFICEIWLFVWYFPQFCTSDMSKYGYLEVFQRVPSTSRLRESTVLVSLTNYFFQCVSKSRLIQNNQPFIKDEKSTEI